MKKMAAFYIVLVIMLLGAASTDALELRIVGNKFSLRADQVPLQTILRRMADLGIRISIEPQLNPKVSASFEDQDIQKGLESILKSYGHALIWETIAEPSGPVHRLAEIQVFRPGKRDLMRPLLGSQAARSIGRNAKDGSSYVGDEILLMLEPEMSLSEFQRLLKSIGGTLVASNPRLGIYRIRLPEGSDVSSLVREIRSHPGIKAAEPNYAYPITRPYRDPSPVVSSSRRFNLRVLEGGAPIAILDTGMIPDAGLESLAVASLDALNPDEAISDSLGHGTQMALIAAGVVKPDGVKKDAGAQIPIIPIRIFDADGYTSNSDIFEAIDFALSHGARVMSLSWGSGVRSDFLESALNYASSQGLIIVASAGNEPTGKPVYPAGFPSVIGVGALSPDGTAWEKSNYGDFVRLYAPGFATLPVGYGGDPGTYAGTSISAAFVANMIASYLSQNPNATIQEVLDSLSDHY